MKRISFIILLASLIFQGSIISAQEPSVKSKFTGSWLGSLDINGMKLRLVFNLKMNPGDSLSATMDSPDQGAKNIPMGRVKVSPDSLSIAAPLLAGYYKGAVTSDSTISGQWTQRGTNFKLDLKKLQTFFTVNRPQEPKPPFPYSSEEVTFGNKKFNIFLSGTLTIPQGKGPFPAVIMITGSGAQNRDEAIMGHKPFLVIADWLTRQGIAVLRYDDRGIGKSQGDYATANSADLATDAAAALEFLKKDSRINQAAIGLMGHSEGGLIAPIVASADPTVGFIVSLAGPGVTGEQILYAQQADIMKQSGLAQDQIDSNIETNKALYKILKKESDNVKAEEKILKTYSQILSKKNPTPKEMQDGIARLKTTFGAAAYPWFRYFLFSDPAVFWKKVKCPVLALNGDKDLQVSSKINLPAIEKAVRSGGNSAIKTVELPGLNHLFQHCKTGLPAEYSEIEETFSEEALKIISEWILSLGKS